jgi:NAD(P)-dependent dehydrogenase (short-subunit alcohol dehydrogenase family)
MPLNPPISDWRDRRVWVIGASTGIGAELARQLLAREAKVAISARNATKLAAVAAPAPNAAKALVAPADVTKVDTLESAYRAILAAWGGLDLVVFMAGNYFPMRAWELTADKARSLLDTNLMGVYNGLSVVLPDMVARGAGGVAIVSSVAGYRGLPKSLVYGPSKAALINLAETLYLDCAPRGLAVYVVNPGFVRTPLTAQNDFEMPHLIEVDEAAREVIAGFATGAFEIHFPKAFSRKLKLLRWLPDRWYFSLIRRSTGL